MVREPKKKQRDYMRTDMSAREMFRLLPSLGISEPIPIAVHYIMSVIAPHLPWLGASTCPARDLFRFSYPRFTHPHPPEACARQRLTSAHQAPAT